MRLDAMISIRAGRANSMVERFEHIALCVFRG
jgi:hypothetical protein